MNTLLDLIQAPPAIAIADLVREKERSGELIAKLQTGEPSFSTPQYIKDALMEALRTNHTGYCSSQGILELRNALKLWYHQEMNVHIKPEEILISIGAVGAIYCSMDALLNPGDEVLVVDPCWPQYINIINLLGATVKRVPTKNSGGRLLAQSLQEHVSNKTKLIIINNPSNPAGIVYGEEEINEFIRIASKHGIYIIFDEVYNRLVFTGVFKSVLQCKGFQKYRDHIIYINSFSKTFAMTGWRVGYAFMEKKLLQSVLKISQNVFTNVPTFCQYAATKALTEMNKHAAEFENMKLFYFNRLKQLASIMDERKISYIKPEGAFYFFFQINQDSLVFSKELLEKNKIAVVPGISYGREFNNYVRISFAVDDYSYDAFLNWLKKDCQSN